MKDFAIGALAWIFLIYCFLYFLFAIPNSIDIAKYEKFLGKELVLCGDTVMMTDYSPREKKFYLSNGAQIDSELAVTIYSIKND